MKHAKKWLALLLVWTFCFTMIAGCAKEEPMEPAGEVSDLSEEKHFGVNSILTNSDDSAEKSFGQEIVSGMTQNPEASTGEFVVSEKKYEFKGSNLMLLYVENGTNKHYDLTISGKYLDQDGKVLKEESQTYRAFPAGWKNYFIFRPKMAFDSFDYTLEVQEFQVETIEDQLYAYNGDPLSPYAELTYSRKPVWTRGWLSGQSAIELDLEYEFINHHESVPLSIEFHMLLLNEQGEICMTDWEWDEAAGMVNGVSGTAADPIGGEDDGKSYIPVKTQPADAERTIPEFLQEDFTIIFAILDVVDMNIGASLWGIAR